MFRALAVVGSVVLGSTLCQAQDLRDAIEEHREVAEFAYDLLMDSCAGLGGGANSYEIEISRGQDAERSAPQPADTFANIRTEVATIMTS